MENDRASPLAAESTLELASAKKLGFRVIDMNKEKAETYGDRK